MILVKHVSEIIKFIMLNRSQNLQIYRALYKLLLCLY